MTTRCHLLDQRLTKDAAPGDPRVVVGVHMLKITTHPIDDADIRECQTMFIDPRQARILAFLLCEAADALEANPV